MSHIAHELIWWACILLEMVLVLRSIPAMFKRFPIFYCYVGSVLLVDLLAIPTYRMLPGFYGLFYWSTAFLTAALGYGVILEIYGRSLAGFPGVSRWIRIVLGGLLFVIAAKALVELFGGAANPWASSAALLERDLRTAQAILLGALLGIFIFYRIAIGKNLRGIIAGYALYVGVRVIELTAYAQLGKADGIFVSQLEPIGYLICLIIWTVALWSPAREPIAEGAPGMERDYGLLLQQTRTKLARACGHLSRTVRP